MTRRRLLSTLKFVQEQTQNLMCWSWAALTASKPLKHMTKLRSIFKFISWDRLETCIICRKNFNNQEKLIGQINTSPWTDFELLMQRHVFHYCKPTLATNEKNFGVHFLLSSTENILYEIFNKLFTSYFIFVSSMKNTPRA